MPFVEGGCYCGAIRYRVAAPLAGAAACHCRKCQYGSGGGPNYVVLSPRADFEVTSGRPVAHASRAESGAEVTRTFCGACGSPLWSDSPNLPFLALRAGSLDDPSQARPVFDKLVRDPDHPDHLLAKFDSGDHLHPSPAGYAAMGEAVPLSLFVAQAAPQIAFTFDDLPAHGSLPPGDTRMEVASKIIAAMRNAHMPPVYGFVNGADTEKFPSDIDVLKAWHSAGNPLGNHSWSHMNANQHTVEEFEADVLRTEPLIESVMDEADWRWFRYPFLAEGDTPAKRQAIRTFLGSHGYRAAAVTMSFGDYRWTEPYARCKAKGDSKAVATLQETYLEAADKSIDYYRELSHGLFGRDIPYVLLMHIGALDSEMLPRLLELYRSRGFQFVTLEQAERDEFYRASTDLRLPPAPDMLEWLAGERHIAMPPSPQLSVEPESLCK